jgi:protein-disulfide isomerase
MASMITPANVITDPGADGVLVAAVFSAHECAYCRSAITAGERWVREKIYDPFAGNAPCYRRYHADLFAGEELSCWERHEMERDLARTAGHAA